MAAQALMKRGKRAVATYFKAECGRASGQQQLNELLDYLLNINESLDDTDRLDWLRWLVAGGTTFDEFGRTVRHYDNAATCGLVWTANFVAYRCRTCGISPCMSLCADCFQAGNHAGHDFNMFRSQAGGACDCGDISVMREGGFCPRHGPEIAKQGPGPPAELLATAEAMMPRLILRALLYLRNHAKPELFEEYRGTLKNAEDFFSYLHCLSEMGAAMRQVITKVVSNPNVYHSLLTGEGITNPDLRENIKQSISYYTQMMETLQAPRIPREFRNMQVLSTPLEHHTLLDELMFWCIIYEFPQKLVTLLLSILPDDNYKEVFTIAFVKHYSRLSIALSHNTDWQTISNRVVHISVQLLSPENLAMQMVDEYGLLYLMLISLEYMMKSILSDSTLHDPSKNHHMVVDCSKSIMKEHCYWPIVSDLINVLSHKDIAFKFMADPKLLKFWFELVSYFQGMNLNQRELLRHVEYEPDTYYSAFSAELEMCASPMWSLLVPCSDQETMKYTKTLIHTATNALKEWFSFVCVKPMTIPNPLQLTFHLPLHRYLASCIGHIVRTQGVPLQDVLPKEEFLQLLLIHPLDVQVGLCEIFANMWVRNGLQIRGQAMTYIQCHFCNSMLDADIFLLQLCATKLDSDFFLKTILERFHVLEMMSFAPEETQTRKSYIQPEHCLPLLEGALTFLASIIGICTNLGMTDEELSRKEMTTLLCMADRTHSQLMDSMPEKCGLHAQTKNFEPTLEKVADFKKPIFETSGGMQQGIYVPKGEVWENDFDPLYVSLRSVHKRDFQASMDRYANYVKQGGLYKGSGSPWPPFRIPMEVHPAFSAVRKLVHSRTYHALLYILLYKAVHETKLSDTVLYLCCHLLELAVTIPKTTETSTVTSQGPLQDKDLSSFYKTDDIYTNLHTTIQEVELKQRLPRESEGEMPGGSSDPDMESFQLAPSAMSLNELLTSGTSVDPPSFESVSESAPPDLPSDPTPETASGEDGNIESLDIVAAIDELMDQAIVTLGGQAKGNRNQVETGVDTTTDTYIVTGHVKLNESMLTLLFQLYKKLSGAAKIYKPESQCSSSSDESADSDSRIGDGTFFIEKILNKAARENEMCKGILEDLYQKSLPKESGKKTTIDPEEKKRRARARQQKLMTEFANKQKKFMENFADDTGDMDEMDTSGTSDESSIKMEEAVYDCVICNQTSTSTQDKPMGLVTLLQSTSVLGHRKHFADSKSLPVPDATSHHFNNCTEELKNRFTKLNQYYEEASVMLSINIGWEGGVHMQSCGHYVHFSCHKSYMESLLGQQAHQQNILVSKGEYKCPLCRKLSNCVVPIMPDIGPTLSLQTPTDPKEKVLRIAEIMANRPISHNSATVTRAMGAAMEDLTNATCQKFRNYSNSQSSERLLLFVNSVARTNLELEILQENLDNSNPIGGTKKPNLLPLLHVLGLHFRLLSTNPAVAQQLWSYLTGLSHMPTTEEIKPYLKEVPLLLRDANCLLIQLMLTMPPTMEKEYYQCIVQSLYNLVYIQAISVMSCKFTEEERSAWRDKSKESSLAGLVGSVIELFSHCDIYTEVPLDPHLPAITHVWSPQSVESAIRQYVLPFLRLASRVQNHLYATQPPSLKSEEEYVSLCKCLGLCSESTSDEQSSYIAVNWFTDSRHDILQSWTAPMGTFANTHISAARMLLMSEPGWFNPQLCRLPHMYDNIFQYYRKKQCHCCNTLPKDPALCLICSQLLCFKECCCTQQGIYECVQHSIDCGGGTGIFLVVNSSVIVVIRGSRATVWGSVYLDEYGEEDRDLKRGKPLYVSEERYKLLQLQWLTHSFDHMCKRWVFHNNKL